MSKEMRSTDGEAVRETVREAYGAIARQGGSCCGGSGCCGPAPGDLNALLGYSEEEAAAAPEGANMGLGCGNPGAIAALSPGEVVLDLGAGGGFDCFLAARKVGTAGRVIGVDMTADMVELARANAAKVGLGNVEFRLGEIERLPVEDSSVDVIISNCVINLSPDKGAVFREAFRALKPGGRLAISDIVATDSIPEEVRRDPALVSACLGGAERIEIIGRLLAEAGFEGIRITPNEASRDFIRDWAPGLGLERHLVSAAIEAVKPA